MHVFCIHKNNDSISPNFHGPDSGPALFSSLGGWSARGSQKWQKNVFDDFTRIGSTEMKLKKNFKKNVKL